MSHGLGLAKDAAGCRASWCSRSTVGLVQTKGTGCRSAGRELVDAGAEDARAATNAAWRVFRVFVVSAARQRSQVEYRTRGSG